MSYLALSDRSSTESHCHCKWSWRNERVKGVSVSRKLQSGFEPFWVHAEHEREQITAAIRAAFFISLGKWQGVHFLLPRLWLLCRVHNSVKCVNALALLQISASCRLSTDCRIILSLSDLKHPTHLSIISNNKNNWVYQSILYTIIRLHFYAKYCIHHMLPWKFDFIATVSE